MEFTQIIEELKKHSSHRNIEGMARFGINTKNTLGVSIPIIRNIAKKVGRNHELALKLWISGIHEARILASLIDEKEKVTELQMEKWVGEFDSWDICDQICSNLFEKTQFAIYKINLWTQSDLEFKKRAGFVLIAVKAVHDKNLDNNVFIEFLEIIKRESNDNRNYVKKSVNWALRQIGKRNKELRTHALKKADEIMKLNTSAARWIAHDAIRELQKYKIY